jgi:tRNA pseudouridine38-40 synthase
MPRYRFILEYDGGPFCGWQRQDGQMSVQSAIEDAVFRFCGERATAAAAGRTDAGVHAIAMPAQIDLLAPRDPFRMMEALNFYLRPQPVAVLAAELAQGDFHVRFSAIARCYLYRIVNRRAPLALEAGRAHRVAPPLDEKAMHQAAQTIIGKHDFSTFRAASCQSASPVKTLTALSVERAGEDVLVRAEAPSFLHHQVRSMVGTLIEIGIGRRDVTSMREALDAKDRSQCGQVAPPEGLYFVDALYAGP